MWTSRAGWLDGLRQWAHSPALGQLCAEERVSITSATLLSIATVMAEHADHATGRHVAVTRATIAARVGCDVRTSPPPGESYGCPSGPSRRSVATARQAPPASAADPRCTTWCRAAKPVQ